MCRSTTGKTSCTKEEETSNTIMLKKLMPLHLDNAVSRKVANNDTKSTLHTVQFFDSLQLDSFADTCSKSNEHSRSKGGSGQSMGHKMC